MDRDEHWMSQVLSLAKTAAKKSEVPIAALIVDQTGRVVSTAFNQKEHNCDATSHAEMEAIRKAGSTLKNWRLLGCTMYTNLEPCVMCAGAIYQARIKRVVFGATDPKMGGVESVFQVLDCKNINHSTAWQNGVLAKQSQEMLSQFFKERR
jgi:tRNA(adenine34) deaminase